MTDFGEGASPLPWAATKRPIPNRVNIHWRKACIVTYSAWRKACIATETATVWKKVCIAKITSTRRKVCIWFIAYLFDLIVSEVEKQKKCFWFVHKLKVKFVIYVYSIRLSFVPRMILILLSVKPFLGQHFPYFFNLTSLEIWTQSIR